VISTIVNSLLDINKKYVLLAPTGRAAKVIPIIRTNLLLQFIKIYFPKKSSVVAFRLRYNKTNTKHHFISMKPL
jgi:hypothetical protein